MISSSRLRAGGGCFMPGLLALLALALLASPAPATAALSSTPDATIQTNGNVNALAQSGNRVFLGGSFTRAGIPTPFGIDVSATAGAPNAAFALPDGQVQVSISDGGGGWYIGGSFSAVGGLPRVRVAHLLSTGAVDPSFAPSVGTGSDSVNALALSPDGATLYVGGTFTTVTGGSTVTRNRVAAFATGGATPGAVTTFNPNIASAVNALALSSDGATLYVGGAFSTVGASTTRNRLAAFSTSGSGAVTGFNPNVAGSGAVVNTVLVSGATVYAGGTFSTVNTSTTRLRVASFDGTTGTVTAGFDAHVNATNPDTSSTVLNALALVGGTLYVGGQFQTVGQSSTARNNIAALDAATGAPTGFDPNVDNVVNTLAPSSDGTTLYAGGQFSQVHATSRNRVAAIDTSSGAPTSFDANVDSTVSTVAVGPGARVYVGGGFKFVGSATVRNRLAAMKLDGTLDPDFDPNIAGTPSPAVDALAVSGGTLYAGGAFATVNGSTARANLAAFDSTATGAATSFDPGANNTINALAASGSTLYAGGLFTSVNGSPGTARNRIAAFDMSTTGTATSFDPNVNSNVNALALSGSTLYAGGLFTTVNNGATARNRLAAFDTASALAAPGFDPNANNTVSALLVSGATLYAGGNFTTVNGTTQNRLAALDTATGLLRPAFVQSVGSAVTALALSGGTLYAGGQFTNVSNFTVTREHLAAFDATTGVVGGFDPNIGNTVFALLTSGSRLYAGGGFNTVGPNPVGNFAQFTDPTPPPSAATGAASAVTDSGATIAGTVNPNGVTTTYHVEYGTSASLGTSTGDVAAGSGTGPVPASAGLSGLTANTTYFYRLVAASSGGTTNGDILTFRTIADPGLSTSASGPVVVGGQISDTATLAGGNAPTGTMTFKLYGPNNGSCADPPVATLTAAVSGNGAYPSPSFTTTAAGTYRWVASYGGDLANNPVGGSCGDSGESVDVAAVATTPICVATALRRPGPSRHDEQDVTISDPAGIASVTNVLIGNGQVFTGGSSGTRIDAQPTTAFPGSPTSAVLTAVKTTQGNVTQWSFDATNTTGGHTHCV